MSPNCFAIIGSGAIAFSHAQVMAAVPEARLVAVWSRSSEQCAKFAAEPGVEFVSGPDDLAARAGRSHLRLPASKPDETNAWRKYLNMQVDIAFTQLNSYFSLLPCRLFTTIFLLRSCKI